MERRSRGLLLALALLLAAASAQYEKYSFRGFPEADLMPLQSAYAYALEQYEGEGWRESIRYLEASLRLHRLLRDSEAHCHQECAAAAAARDGKWGEAAEEGARRRTGRLEALGEPAAAGAASDEWLREMELFALILQRASCLRRCKRSLPVFQVNYPPAEILRDFQRRAPYQYLHYALYKVS